MFQSLARALCLLTVLLVGAPRTVVAQKSGRDSADAARAELTRSALAFFARWGDAWQAGEQERLRRSRDGASRRLAYLHCHAPGVGTRAEQSRPLAPGYLPIRSSFTPFSVCPTWELGRSGDLPDEARSIDAGIATGRLAAIRRERAALIEQFAAATRAFPGDDFLVGQQVRLLLDQGERLRALNVATACEASRWWCTALVGYVHHGSGNFAEAEAAFTSARTRMPPAIRCTWDDLSLLRPDSVTSTHASGDCDAKLALSARYWWLADPLWSEPGNERWVEHEARQVHLAAWSSSRRWHSRPRRIAHTPIACRQ